MNLTIDSENNSPSFCWKMPAPFLWRPSRLPSIHLSPQANTAVRDYGQAAGPKSGCNRPFWITQPPSCPWVFIHPALLFGLVWFSGQLDQSCLTGKKFNSLQSSLEYVWFKLDFESIYSPLWSSLSNMIIVFYLLWCWCLLFNSFHLLVQFLQLRCQADKQGKLCKWCLGEL